MDTFCLVHGAWHDDACWELLVTELERRGHECVTPVLPLEDGGASYEDYAAVVIECLKGRDAPVLVGHSMSSAVIPLVAVRRAVRLLVYLCPAMGGFPPPPDEPRYQRPGYERPPVDADGRSWWPHDRAVSQLYGRLDRTSAARMAARLRPQPQTVFGAPYPLERPPEVPSTLLYAREDELFDDNGRDGSRAACLVSKRSSCRAATSRCSSTRRSSPTSSSRSAARLLPRRTSRSPASLREPRRHRSCRGGTGLPRGAESSSDARPGRRAHRSGLLRRRAARRSQRRSSPGHPPGSTRCR